MSITFKGESFGFLIAGDRTHDFVLPFNRATIPPKTAAAFDNLLAARDAEAKTTGKRGKAADLDANAKVKEALEHLYDVANGTTKSRQQHHAEEYATAASKLNRCLAEAEAALQVLVDHAMQAENPTGIGINQTVRNGNGPTTVATLRALADDLANLTPVPALDA
ncbi:hypothetical protein JHN49_11335 [Streptomyces sp. MBT57]|nr:hypothetical protein [Streptomyces sp. MBT57]